MAKDPQADLIERVFKDHETRDRELPDGSHITFYEQLYNWKVTYSSAESWPYGWDEAY